MWQDMADLLEAVVCCHRRHPAVGENMRMAPRWSMSTTWSGEGRAIAHRDTPDDANPKSPMHKPAPPRIWLAHDLLPCAADRSRSWLHRERLAVAHQRPQAARDAEDGGSGRGHRCERLASGGEARQRRVPLVGRGRPVRWVRRGQGGSCGRSRPRHVRVVGRRRRRSGRQCWWRAQDLCGSALGGAAAALPPSLGRP
jgi:hypothetical protein